MVALGLLLLLVALAVGVLAAWLAARSAAGVLLEGAGLSVTVPPLTLLALGAAVVVVLWLGWRLIVAGSRRRRAEREELRQLRSSTRGSASGDTPVGRGGPAPGRRDAQAAAAAPSTPTESPAPDRAVQPRSGGSSPPAEGSGSHAGDRPPRS